MRRCWFFGILILTISLVSCTANPNPIEGIASEQSLLDFLSEYGIATTDEVMLESDETNIDQYAFGQVAEDLDTVPVFSTGDFTGDGNTDLIFHYNNDPLQILPRLVEYVDADSFLVHHLEMRRYVGAVFAYGARVDGRALPVVIRKDYSGEHRDRYYYRDTISYQEGLFVDYVQPKPVKMPVRVRLEVFGGWLSIHEELTIDVSSGSYKNLFIKENNDTIVRSGYLHPQDCKQLTTVLRSIDYSNLDSLYVADWSDDATTYTTFEFEGGDEIGVEDYGKVATKSMAELYKVQWNILSTLTGDAE